MIAYKELLLFTLNHFLPNYCFTAKEYSLQESSILFRAKVFYRSRNSQNLIRSNITKIIQIRYLNNPVYRLLFLEILYILNFKKSFTSRNFNRVTSNYFKIFFLGIEKNKNKCNLSHEFADDMIYLSTLAFCTLYIISEIYSYEQKFKIKNS